MSTTSETAFTQSAETVYDFVTNPRNWTKTYPGQLFLQANPAKIDAYHEAVARELARSAD